MNRIYLTLPAFVAVSVFLCACKDSGSADGTNNTKVFKSSGYVQCETETRIPLNAMVLELVGAGIDVLCSQTGADGLAYPAVCGHASGEINIYVIRTVNLEDAENLGFASVMTLPEYRDQPCQ